jgi:hypothetical protein
MIYLLTDIIRDVRVAMDENMVSDSLIKEEDIDTLALEDIIKSKVLEGVRRVEMVAPPFLLEQGHNFDGDAVYWEDLESGYVLLPDDFMRLVCFRMSDWSRGVYTPIEVDDEEYQKQSSPFKGIRGNTENPVCAIVNRPTGKALEFYSCESEDAYVTISTYIPYPEIDEDGGVDISQRCYTAVIYTVAALVLTTYGNTEQAKALTELAGSILQQ